VKKATIAIMIVLLGTCFGTDAMAQGGLRWRGGGGWGPGGQYGRLYDPKTVETVKGEVVDIDQITPHKGMGYGVHVRLKTGMETIAVHLGPSWYIEHQDIKIQPKDEIEVKGSRVTFDGNPALIAAEVRKGSEILLLRDASGVPMWAGWRRRP
jgi:hypothetical protein